MWIFRVNVQQWRGRHAVGLATIGRICVHAKSRVVRFCILNHAPAFFIAFQRPAAAPAQLPIARALWIRSICRVYPFKYRRARCRFTARFCDTKRGFFAAASNCFYADLAEKRDSNNNRAIIIVIHYRWLLSANDDKADLLWNMTSKAI